MTPDDFTREILGEYISEDVWLINSCGGMANIGVSLARQCLRLMDALEKERRETVYASENAQRLMDALSAERAARDEDVEALHHLVSQQNGPPLIRFEKEWCTAMDKADARLAKHREDRDE